MYLLPPGIFKTFMAWMKKNYCESLEFMLSIFVVFVSNPPSRIYILDESQTKNYSFSLKLKITHPRNYIPTDKPKPIIHENCPLEFKWFHCIRPAHTNDNKWIRHSTSEPNLSKLSSKTLNYKHHYINIQVHVLIHCNSSVAIVDVSQNMVFFIHCTYISVSLFLFEYV